jgi:DNA invertase Pin-like site-specific DNA recombinase
MLIGYARVSTTLQETDLQLDALRSAGARCIFQEKTSSVGSRPRLQDALASLSSGDILLVYKLDRVARSLKDLLLILERVSAVGAGFKSLTEPIDTSSPVGVFILQILGAVAQFERSLIRERAIAGQVAAYRRGVRWGGQPKCLTPDDEEYFLKLRATGCFTMSVLADFFGCSVSTLDRVVSRSKRPKLVKSRRLPVLRGYL